MVIFCTCSSPLRHPPPSAVSQTPCGAGNWSNVTGLGVPCYLLCDAGYVCTAGSRSPQSQQCGGPSVYCPAGSGVTSPVQAGYLSTGGTTSTRTSRALCPAPGDAMGFGLGLYCPGDGYNYTCPPGVYGAAVGLSAPSCSGPCSAGYYCPAGSANATAVACGSVAVYVAGQDVCR